MLVAAQMADENEMAKVLTPLNHDGRRYEPGEDVELPADVHAALAEAGVVSPPDPEPGPKKSRAK